MNNVPVLTIDGPSGSGKGTVGKILANQLGWHFLDSGAVYRVIGLAALQQQIELTDQEALVQLIKTLHIQFTDKVLLNHQDVSSAIRNKEVGDAASQASQWPKVRDVLLQLQRDFRRPPGLVADGRDMGTVVFPDAATKIFLEADIEERAKRRCRQLQQQGIDVTLTDILSIMQERDRRDRDRQVAPLKPADDAIVIDSTRLSVEEVVTEIMQRVPSSK